MASLRWQKATRIGLILTLPFHLMLEGIACNRSENMAAQASQIAAPENAKQRALEAMEKLQDFKQVRLVVFAILTEDLSQQTRFEIMQKFAERYKRTALEEIKKEILLVGATSEKTTDLGKNEPKRLDYMTTLAYGLALFGENGFETAIDIVKKGREMQMHGLTGKPKHLLLDGIATMAVYMIVNNKLVDKENALQKLSELIQNPSATIVERDLFIGWSIRIKPAAACDLKQALAKDELAMLAVTLRLEQELKGLVPCAR